LHKQISVVTERMKSTMRFNEVRDATDCFSIDKAIGMGKIGIMYEGRLPNGWNLAIKRLFDSKQYKRQFILEIRILGRRKRKDFGIPVHVKWKAFKMVESFRRWSYIEMASENQNSNWGSKRLILAPPHMQLACCASQYKFWVMGRRTCMTLVACYLS